jgi:hypothetical protein
LGFPSEEFSIDVAKHGRNAMRIILAATCAVMCSIAVAQAQQKPAAESSEQEYLTRVMSAAPPQVVEEATIVRMENGNMHVLKKGSSAWTCMEEAGGVPMCLDPNAMEWAHAWQTHGPAPNKTGFIYMMAGDTGASNTDPYATEQKADNHWVQTGSHVMIVGPGAKTMAGYPKTADPDSTRPYVMWPGSPYEHVMIPVQ